jgi:hypothetical protein
MLGKWRRGLCAQMLLLTLAKTIYNEIVVKNRFQKVGKNGLNKINKINGDNL